MIVEKDTKTTKDDENIMHLQTELIKINTYLQTCETFENNTAKDDENIKEHRFDFQ